MGIENNLKNRITNEQRKRVLAMTARGDTDVSVAQVVGISAQSVAIIRRRNKDLLEKMKNTIDTYRAQKATDILDKSENLMIRKLNKALDQEEDRLTLDELSRISKSAYERVRLESGRATSISASDTNQPAKTSQIDLEQLVDALKNKDEVELQKIIFREAQ